MELTSSQIIALISHEASNIQRYVGRVSVAGVVHGCGTRQELADDIAAAAARLDELIKAYFAAEPIQT